MYQIIKENQIFPNHVLEYRKDRYFYYVLLDGKRIASFHITINTRVGSLSVKLQDVDDLYELLENALYEEPPISIKEGYLIKEGYSHELDELKDLRSGGKNFISNFELEEKERTGIKNLKVGFNKVFGYYIEVSKGNLNLITEDMGYIRKQTLTNCERFITPLLKEKEDLIFSAEEKIINLEYELFI